MDTVTRYRVYNRCQYDIGVMMQNGIGMNIKAGGFQMMTADDIAYVESICGSTKFFAQKMLVPVDNTGKDVELEKLYVPTDPDAPTHMNDDEITAALKAPVKKFEEWLKQIEDPAELHAIYNVAKEIDLPASKLKILSAKMPNKDWLDQQ